MNCFIVDTLQNESIKAAAEHADWLYWAKTVETQYTFLYTVLEHRRRRWINITYNILFWSPEGKFSFYILLFQHLKLLTNKGTHTGSCPWQAHWAFGGSVSCPRAPWNHQFLSPWSTIPENFNYFPSYFAKCWPRHYLLSVGLSLSKLCVRLGQQQKGFWQLWQEK